MTVERFDIQKKYIFCCSFKLNYRDLDRNLHRSASIHSMLIGRWIENANEIHRVNSYGIETLKHGHASYFIAQLIKSCSITKINFSEETVNYQHALS